MATWTLETIQNKVRALTGRASVNQLSDTDLTAYINKYYQYVLPADLKPMELMTYWEFNTVASVDEEELDDDDYVVIEPFAYVDGYEMNISFNADAFRTRWPEYQTYDSSRPTDALFYGQTLIMRPAPDDAYEVKIQAWARPAALAGATSTPVLEGWGPIIAYGAAMEIAEDNGDLGRVQELVPLYQLHLNRAMRKSQQQLNNVRSIPRF